MTVFTTDQAKNVILGQYFQASDWFMKVSEKNAISRCPPSEAGTQINTENGE